MAQIYIFSFPGDSDSEESACQANDMSLIPGSGRSLRKQNGYPLQYSCLENSVDRGAWQALVHGSQRVRYNKGNNISHFKHTSHIFDDSQFPMLFTSFSLFHEEVQDFLFTPAEAFYLGQARLLVHVCVCSFDSLCNPMDCSLPYQQLTCTPEKGSLGWRLSALSFHLRKSCPAKENANINHSSHLEDKILEVTACGIS